MKPYYDDGQTTIYHGDCRDILPLLEPNTVDLVLTDPDYNGKDIGIRQGSYTDDHKIQMPEHEYEDWCMHWFNLCCRFTDRLTFTPGIGNVHMYPAPRWMLAWYKPGAVSFNRTGGFNIWEPVMVYGAKVPRIIQDAYESTPLNLTREIWSAHPCPKHPGFWRWVLGTVGRPGETVLDPFLGSGTTARVAKDLGLKCIGIELEERWCDLAVRRLSQEVLPLQHRLERQQPAPENLDA